jgi:hypothetical protein
VNDDDVKKRVTVSIQPEYENLSGPESMNIEVPPVSNATTHPDIMHCIDLDAKSSIMELPPVLSDGTVSWLSSESVGLAHDAKIKGFYHGNLLFVVKANEYTRAKQVLQDLFIAPSIDNVGFCNACNKYFPNIYARQTHDLFRIRNNECPWNVIYDGATVTAALYVSTAVLTFLEKACEEYKVYIPFDFLDPCAPYCNFIVEVARHTSQEVLTLVKQERGWLNETTKAGSFLKFLFTKYYMYNAKCAEAKSVYHSGLYPVTLSFPYIDVKKAAQLLEEGSTGIPEVIITEVKKKAAITAKGRDVVAKKAAAKARKLFAKI